MGVTWKVWEDADELTGGALMLRTLIGETVAVIVIVTTKDLVESCTDVAVRIAVESEGTDDAISSKPSERILLKSELLNLFNRKYRDTISARSR